MSTVQLRRGAGRRCDPLRLRADVIKVEPPQGDTWRRGHQTPVQPQSEDAYQWHLASRNKRSIALNPKAQSAQQVLFELVNWADVLIVNTPHHARK